MILSAVQEKYIIVIFDHGDLVESRLKHASRNRAAKVKHQYSILEYGNSIQGIIWECSTEILKLRFEKTGCGGGLYEVNTEDCNVL